MEKRRHWAFFLLALSAAWSACFSSGIDNPMDRGAAEGLRGHTVSFERNCTRSIEEFARKNVKPPAKTVEDFPENPTCEGRRFVEWNTAIDGSGAPFTAQTPIPPNEILVIVYAKWEKLSEELLPVPPVPPLPPVLPIPLRIEMSHTALRFSPMVVPGSYDGRAATFSVAVSGFRNEADADDVDLMPLPLPQGFSPLFENSSYAEGTKTFRVHVSYAGNFTEAPFTLQPSFTNLPEGYEYGGETPSIHVVLENGQANNPISLTQDNILAFNGYANNAGRSMHYRLVADIVLEAPVPGASNWTAIGTSASNQAFTGSLDGNGRTISGLVIHNPGTHYQGLFGYIAAPAEIKNLGLIGLSVSASNRSYVGGLVGANSGATVQNSYVTGSVSGSGSVGGLVGYNNGGTVENSYVMGSVSGGDNVGGLVGYNTGTVQSSYVTGSVAGSNEVGGLVGYNYYSTVQNSYATGSVEGSYNVGGLLGYNSGGTVQNSYATSSVSGGSEVGGVVGYNVGTVENCVALNPSVSANSASSAIVGRVVGSTGGVMRSNYARSMMLNPPRAIVGDGNNSSSVDGQSVSPTQYNNLLFWSSSPLSWNFNTIWQWGANGLPVLQNVGGTQNHTVP